MEGVIKKQAVAVNDMPTSTPAASTAHPEHTTEIIAEIRAMGDDFARREASFMEQIEVLRAENGALRKQLFSLLPKKKVVDVPSVQYDITEMEDTSHKTAATSSQLKKKKQLRKRKQMAEMLEFKKFQQSKTFETTTELESELNGKLNNIEPMELCTSVINPDVDKSSSSSAQTAVPNDSDGEGWEKATNKKRRKLMKKTQEVQTGSTPSTSRNSQPSVTSNCPAKTTDTATSPKSSPIVPIIIKEPGGGSKPILERDDDKVNAIADCEIEAEVEVESRKKCRDDLRSPTKNTEEGDASKTQDPIDPPDKRKMYVHHGCCGKFSNTKCHSDRRPHKRLESSASKKVPYYRDSIRERDRLKRLYGDCYNPKSGSKTPERERISDSSYLTRTKYHEHKDEYKSKRSRSPYRSPTQSRTATHYPQHGRDSRSPQHSRRWHSAKHRKAASPSFRSERERWTESELVKDREDDRAAPPTPFISVPVAIAEYSYPFPHWRYPNGPWPQPLQYRASGPSYGFPVVPFIPTMRPLAYGGPPTAMSFPPMPIAPYRPNFARPPPLRHGASHNQHHYHRQQGKR